MITLLFKTRLPICLILALTLALTSCENRSSIPIGYTYKDSGISAVVPDSFNIDRYNFFIWAKNRISLTGNPVKGFSTTVKAGETLYVNVLIDDFQVDMFYIWFELRDVNLDDPAVTADSLGMKHIACDPFNAKWLTLPVGLTGSLTIEFTDKTGIINKDDILIPITLTVAVVSAN